MNYKNINLDKGMYKHEKGFLGMLEEMDPSVAYQNSHLKGLDAFERQLSRFDIKVKGAASSPISKFFASSQAAALFPEYITRAVAQGAIESSILDDITASKTMIDTLDYRSIATDVNYGSLTDTILEGEAIPETTITLNQNMVKLKKRGRMLSASYEAIKYQRIDVFSVALAQIGNYIAKSHLKNAVDTLIAGTTAITATGALKYDNLLDLWSKFDDFEMNVLLVSPDMAREILAITELRDPLTGLNFQNAGNVATPFGAKLLKSSVVPVGTAIALDKRFALEMVSAGGIQVEYDKLIDAQLERASVTEICGFSKIFSEAVKILKKA